MIRCLNICLTILCVIVFGPLIIVGMDFILETVANTVAAQKKLRSLITADTLISGFYGPGSWWAWLITLGMTHAHSLVATAEPDEWDYDLVAASGYTITAAIDLTLKARTIEKLGASACESPLLPAMLCAERAVWVGTGSSFFTIATAIYIGGPAHRRRAAIAIIPLLIASIVSWFALGAHRTIFPTNVNLRCRLVDGGMMEPEDIYFTFVDFPASMIDILILNILPDVYTSRIHWLVAAGLTVPLTGIISLVDGGLSWTAFRRALAGAVLFPCIIVGFYVSMGIITWSILWVMFWPLVYILAFLPKLGFFPLTGMSVMDMDQLAALLGVGFIGAFRSGRRILKAVHNRAASAGRSAHDTAELQPLLDP